MERACTLLDMRRAELLASADPAAPVPAEPGEAWLRLWAETLVLAFLTGRAWAGGARPAAPLVAWP